MPEGFQTEGVDAPFEGVQTLGTPAPVETLEKGHRLPELEGAAVFPAFEKLDDPNEFHMLESLTIPLEFPAVLGSKA